MAPRLWLSAATASAATTVAMSVGFVVSARVWGAQTSLLPAGALITIYLVASAAGGAAPVPAFLGVTEGALVAGLLVGGYPLHGAVVAVVAFRAITYWVPLPLGLWASRRLFRASLL